MACSPTAAIGEVFLELAGASAQGGGGGGGGNMGPVGVNGGGGKTAGILYGFMSLMPHIPNRWGGIMPLLECPCQSE